MFAMQTPSVNRRGNKIRRRTEKWEKNETKLQQILAGENSLWQKNEKFYVPTVTSCQRSKHPATWGPSPSTSARKPHPFDWFRVIASNRILQKLRKPGPKPVWMRHRPNQLRSLWWTQLCLCFPDLRIDCLNVRGICSRHKKDSRAQHSWNRAKNSSYKTTNRCDMNNVTRPLCLVESHTLDAA